MRKTRALASAAIGVLIVLGMAPTVSAAAPIRCGDTITTDVVLTQNLTCSGDGLRVEPGVSVTIDLNGYRLRGDGTGIGINVGAPQVTITNGRIEGFFIGVRPRLFAQARLHRVTLTANTHGVHTELGRMEITDSTFVRNDVGLEHIGYTTVTGSTFRENGEGVRCRNADLQVVGSHFSNNQHGIDSWVCGVTVEASSFTGGDVGLSLEPIGFGMNIRSSTFKGAGIGIRVKRALGGARVIADNKFTDNGASGLVIDNDPAWPGVQVRGNLFKGNGFVPGSHVDPAGSPLTSGVWSDEGTTFTGNRAIGNAGHGIEAYGATDGGGNTAQGNGAEPQCVGVVCTQVRQTY